MKQTPPPPWPTAAARRQRGAALLLAMVILTLVATLAAGMVWQQWRAIQVESAERARTQAAWLLTGALDWSRLILREDGRQTRTATGGSGGGAGQVDHLGEPWATPLAPTRLSTFLAGGQDTADGGIDAYLSGQIIDAQSRYNLMSLYAAATPEAARQQLEVVQRLCTLLGLPDETAFRIASPIQRLLAKPATPGGSSGESGDEGADPERLPQDLLLPATMDDLVWLGVDPEVIRRLLPFVDILPGNTKVNINTASAEVIAVVSQDFNRGGAERLVQARRGLRDGFESVPAALALVDGGTTFGADRFDVASAYFEVRGRIRYEETTVEQRSIVHREGVEVRVVRRERVQSEPDS
jgi:general secretion pathway protein K